MLQRVFSFFVQLDLASFQAVAFLHGSGVIPLQLIDLPVQGKHLFSQLFVFHILHLDRRLMHRTL